MLQILLGKQAYDTLCSTVKRLSDENQALKAANKELSEAMMQLNLEGSNDARRFSKTIAKYDINNIALQREIQTLRETNMALATKVLAFEIKFKHIRQAVSE